MSMKILLVGALLAGAATSQTRWNIYTQSRVPEPFGMAISFDPATRDVLAFGGSSTQGRPMLLDETWSWSPAGWRRRRPAQSPPARVGTAMAYDERRQRVVLYGGLAGGMVLSDTWEWDGSTWTQRHPATNPGPEAVLPMFYNPISERVTCVTALPQTEVWEWDGADWHRLPALARPPVRGLFGAALDERRQRIVLFGGSSHCCTESETWEYDGRTWQQRHPATSPGPRYDLRLTYDRRRGVTVLTGGRTSGPDYRDLWEWDGTDWVDRTTGVLPIFGISPTTYDPDRGELVLLYYGFGGNEIREYGPVHMADYASFGTGCAGSAGTAPALAALPGSRPWLGDEFTIEATLPAGAGFASLLTGISATSLAGFPLPADLTAFGLTGCALLTSSDLATPFQWLGGRLLVTMRIPNDPALAGAGVFQQVAASDAAANPAGMILSHGARLTVGAR